MIVQNFDRFDETRRFDPTTGAFTPAAGERAPAYGHYALLADTPVVLYRAEQGLRLRIDRTTTPVDDTRRVSLQQQGRRRVLRVTDRETGRIVASLEYTLPEPIVAPEDDPTPFAEAEDFDFGLFITNVANDRGRRNRIYHGPDRS